jgi:glycosyltransferase involved in cell wall biosynthesis
MKIVVDGFPLRVRGAGIKRYTYEILRHLASLGPHDYYISDLFVPLPETLLPRTNDPLPFQQTLRQLVARSPAVWPVIPQWLRDLFNQRRLRHFAPDLYFGPSFFGLFAPPTKTVITIHDMGYARFPEATQWFMRRHLRKRLLRDARGADAILADSAATKADVVSFLGVPEAKIHVVYAGVAGEFRPIIDAATLDAVRARYTLPPRFLLFLGTIEPRKNLLRLLQAFRLLAEFPGFEHRLVLAGDKGWSDRAILQALQPLQDAGQVVLTGRVAQEDLPALYSLAEAFAFPSLWEGFGLPVLEAMACGTPVVTANVSSLPEVAGDAALLVDPLSVEELAHALRRVLTDADLREELRRKGLERAKQFTWEKAAHDALSVFEQVAQR